MKKLPYFLIFLCTILILESCNDMKDSKPGTARLSEMTDKEILQIFIDEGVNPDNVNKDGFDDLRKYGTESVLNLETSDDLRNYLSTIQEQARISNERYDSLTEILESKKKSQLTQSSYVQTDVPQ